MMQNILIFAIALADILHNAAKFQIQFETLEKQPRQHLLVAIEHFFIRQYRHNGQKHISFVQADGWLPACLLSSKPEIIQYQRLIFLEKSGDKLTPHIFILQRRISQK